MEWNDYKGKNSRHYFQHTLIHTHVRM